MTRNFSTKTVLAGCAGCLAMSGNLTQAQPAAGTVRTTVILVRGAPGAAEFSQGFEDQVKAWQEVAGQAGAEILNVGGPAASAPLPETGVVTAPADDRAKLEKILTTLPHEGPAEVWMVLIGHGTSDGKEARFNLEGPDLSATDLAGWLKPLRRPLVVINTASSSAPFLPALAGPDRTIITATRSGNERNFARFGQHLAAALTDPAADQDRDGTTSLLEWFLAASNRTTEFYLTEGRIRTEHALIDDNGDGRGTPADWFRGLRATTKARDNTPLDGARSLQTTLIPDDATRKMTPAQLTERTRLEAELNALREKKSGLPEEDYYQQLETLMRALAALYQTPAGP